MLKIGSHVSFGKEQILTSTKEAISYGANTFMFYTGAPTNTIRKEIDNQYTEQALKLMEENGITIKSEVNEDYILYDIKTTTSQIDLALNILNEVFNNANFNDNEIEKARKELIDNAKRRYDIPVNQAVDNFYTTLHFS